MVQCLAVTILNIYQLYNWIKELIVICTNVHEQTREPLNSKEKRNNLQNSLKLRKTSLSSKEKRSNLQHSIVIWL